MIIIVILSRVKNNINNLSAKGKQQYCLISLETEAGVIAELETAEPSIILLSEGATIYKINLRAVYSIFWRQHFLCKQGGAQDI